MSESLNKNTDEDLARSLQQNNEAALGVIIDRYGPKLLRYGQKFLANQDHIEDIVQDVFIKVYQNIQGFDVKRKFSPWIYRIAHNLFVNYLRDRDKQPLVSFDFDALIEHHIYEDQAIEQKEKEEMSVLLEKGLKELTAPLREVVILHYFENLSYQEIVDIIHIPIGTVSIRLYRARELLKKNIQHGKQL